ncbi:FAD-dependent oxidoreductase [Rhodococcus sp. WS4]|nr:FAD-dependent oxidoreductase [Rhodococcus sp. WS4]
MPEETDVIVVGSGAAGLMAALSAAQAGARVLMVESEPLLGGTTAISGGATWVPNHGFASKRLKTPDNADMARQYLLGEGREKTLDHDVVESFIENAPKMARFVEEHTYLGWLPAIWPDYHSDIEGAAHARALYPGPFPPDLLGEAVAYVRPPKKSGMSKNPLPLWLLNRIQGVWIAGRAMVGGFLEGCLRHGVEVRVEARAARLVVDDHGVSGLVVEADGREHAVVAKKGVILASGGFETSNELTNKYLGAEFAVQVTPKGHDGAAVVMAEAVNAAVGAIDETWWMPAMQVPGEQMDGNPIARLVLGERGLPHTIMVNRKGERFVNEAAPYNDLGKIMRQIDPTTHAMPNASVWMIFDEFYRRHYGIFGNPPWAEIGPHVVQADTLPELARHCDIDEDELVRTVEAFNPEANRGRDPWFHRGETIYDRFFGDHHPRLGRLSPDALFPAATARGRQLLAKLVGPIAGPLLAWTARSRKPDLMRAVLVPLLAWVMRPCLRNPRTAALGPIDTPPYYAVKIEASTIGTIGGPKADGRGRVLDVNGKTIPGLYAAGNAAAGPTEGFYGGLGGTITLGLTFGYLAGQQAASR